MANPEFSSLNRIESRGPQEACGITGNYSKKGKNISPQIPQLQRELQHRGQDSAGSAVWTDNDIKIHRGLGKVDDVFPKDFSFEQSDRGIGHNRYGTSGENNKDSNLGAQPFVAEWNGRKIAIAYNGNLPESLREELKRRIPSQIPESTFDTEDIANAIITSDGNSWEEKIKNGLNGIEMAYSLTILTDDGRVFGLRGPSGTWPLWQGETDDEIIFSSETRVKKDENIKWTEVMPGELVEATKVGVKTQKIFDATNPLFHCALHAVYGAREDSLMSKDISFLEFRKELGRQLARESKFSDEIDLIVGVPHTGLAIAEGFAEELDRKPTLLIVKNGLHKESEDRSFIAPSLKKTSEIVSKKYAIPNPEVAKDKKVLLIDDSIIRGRTMGGDPENGFKGIIDFVKDAGASEVHLAVILPKFVAGCDLGYYIRKDQLIALAKNKDGKYFERTEQEIADIIGANSVHFLSMDGLKEIYERSLGQKEISCMACMGGDHPLNVIREKKEAATLFSA